MNWNYNDTKYILKRFIIYILVAVAMFLIGIFKANASTYSEFLVCDVPGNQYTYNITTQGVVVVPTNCNGNNYSPFKNKGEGELIFSFQTLNSSSVTEQVMEVQAMSNGAYMCDIGTTQTYYDSTTQVVIYTARCKMNIESNGITQIKIMRGGTNGTLQIRVGELMTFVKKDGTSVSVDVHQQEVVNAITNSQQAEINAITNASNQAHQDAQQAHQDAQQAHNDSQAINNSINNDNITSSDADDLTNNQAFTDSTGLQAVIELPLNMINSLTNTCQPINITIPWLDYTGTIPCMSTIYRSKFNSLYQVVKLIINGFLVYRLLLKVYELVHEAKQPDEDKLEVIDL